jgi:hypothetical protein
MTVANARRNDTGVVEGMKTVIKASKGEWTNAVTHRVHEAL